MTKTNKLVAVLSAAALLAIGASMTSFAATAHWDQEDGEWVYLDRNGDKVTGEWKKSNNIWYYLNDDGYMAKDEVIEDDDNKYYVDAEGARVTNAWVSMDNDDYLDEDDVDTVWMYFDSTGKALGAGTTNGEIKKLSYGESQSGYFLFNSDGYMLTGWQDWSKSGSSNQLYYFGTQDEGFAYTGWQKLEIDTDDDAFSGINEDDYDDEEWFYFKSTGKAVRDDTQTIGGKTYVFDENGIMQDLWVYTTTASDSGYTNSDGSSVASNSAYYAEENGGRGKNWIFAYPNTNYDDYGDDPYWFYLDSNGKPFKAEAGNKLTAVGSAERLDDDQAATTDADASDAVGAKAISSHTYLFNKNGVMLTGVFDLKDVYKGTSTIPMDDGIYYFTIDDNHGTTEGQMVTNKKVTLDVNGDDETYYFKKSGAAYTNTIISGTLYGADGTLMNDYGDGSTYQMVTATDDIVKKGSTTVLIAAGENFFVNESGKVKESGTFTDVNGDKWKVSSYTTITAVDND